MSPPLALVAAVASNRVIGDGDTMPWRLSSDLKRFRALTMGKPLIMGRKTFQSIGQVLPGRETIIVTRDAAFSAPQADAPSAVHVVHDLDAALSVAAARAAAMGADEMILAGGGVLYEALMDRVQRMYLTFVDAAPEGGVRFPIIDWSQWIEESRIRPAQGPKDETSFTFAEFLRR
ncbi:dihydrofolate reductase [Methylocapsa palsarum]|uniref:Dihydrofolate reductase n=1 Tax=Methylocapsa palsarum TaxID=1612308 RepID=A0A1I3ZUS0_9HYPH|nr:dihydrofolate reductase [Methylocapsa palsarum]SFK47279.1 dihydrofolate reductase [Methylocapsa palsarum]